MSKSPPVPTPDQAESQRQALLNGPAAPPPSGVMPNFDNAANLDPYVILTITLCVSLGTVSVLLRMYTKKYVIRSLAYEDCGFLVG